MLENKLNLKEDLEIGTSFEGVDLDSLYDDFGSELFSDENIPYLKEAGLINEDGYPLRKEESWDGEEELIPLSIQDLYEWDPGFINKSDYIKQLIKKEIYENAGSHLLDSTTISFNYTDEDLPTGIRDYADRFISACFAGDALDFFDYSYSDYSFNDCEYVLDDIPDEVLNVLESYGFPRDIYTKLISGEENEDSDSPLAEYYDDLKDAMIRAYQYGYEVGSANEAVSAFDEAFRESMPDGVVWNEQHSDESKRPIIIYEKFVDNAVEDMWNSGDYLYDGQMYSGLIEFLIKELINENIADNFREPYYGWQEFDKEVFGDYLLDLILELDIKKKEPEQEEKSLLDFDGESGEYHEDLEIEDEVPAKPRKIYFDKSFKKENPELSSKSYFLDAVRLDMLIQKLTALDDLRYVDHRDLDNLIDMLDNVDQETGNTGVLLSEIKPSYLDTYGEPGYTIWDCRPDDFLEPIKYIGYIPMWIGNEILNGGSSILEDLEVETEMLPELPKKDGDVVEIKTIEDRERLIAVFNFKLWYLKKFPEYLDTNLFSWKLIGVDNRSNDKPEWPKIFFYMLYIIYTGRGRKDITRQNQSIFLRDEDIGEEY